MEVKSAILNSLNKGLIILFLSLILLFGLFFKTSASTNTQSNTEGRTIFELKCKACHTIGGGPLAGPDLLGVIKKRDREWLERWLAEPDKVLAEGDPIAIQLLEEFNNVPMPNLALTNSEVQDLLAYLETAEPGSSEVVALTGGDAAKGTALFSGGTRLQNGGTACLSCHNVSGVGALGGGTLGPDLTNVYSRYGENGLIAALGSLPFPSMQGIFLNKPLTENEQADLLAFFELSNRQSAKTSNRTSEWMLVIGGLGALVLFGVMYPFWPRQRRSLAESLRERA